jgi:hypothetical protein
MSTIENNITLLETIIRDTGDLTKKRFLPEADLKNLGYKFGNKSLVVKAVQNKKNLEYMVIEVVDIDDTNWVPSFCLLKVSSYKYPFTLNFPYKKYSDIYNQI